MKVVEENSPQIHLESQDLECANTDRRFVKNQTPCEQNYQQNKTPNHTIILGKKNFNFQQPAHPTICLFAIVFKIMAFTIYLFGSIFVSKVICFIFVTILGSLDFWIIKNIAGRLLVGLRWWSTYDQEGNEVWKFETHEKEYTPNHVDKVFFWNGQIISTCIWALFLFLNILSLDLFDSILLGINFLFCGTNLYGYHRCSNEYSHKVGELKKKIGQKGLINIASKFI